MKIDERVEICAKVEAVIHPKADALASLQGGERTFYIIKCDVGTVKGYLTHAPKKGEEFRLDGSWQISKFNGRPEFAFIHASVHIPGDQRTLLHYACEMTKDFGPALEARIWDALGDEWRKLTTDISGVTPARLAAFQDTIRFVDMNGALAKTVAWLVSIGCTVKMAEAAFDKWGADTVMRVKDDPYILAQLPHYGFRDIDTHIREHFDIGRNDERRVRAAILYAVGMRTQSDTVVEWGDVLAAVMLSIDADKGEVIACCKRLFETGILAPFPNSMSLSKKRDYDCESAILGFARRSHEEGEISRLCARQPKGRDFDLDTTQMDAVQFAINHRFAIINGGAGVGKTTIVRAICDSYRGDVVLCSFAGKAAARLREATDHDASTIHRMLGWIGDANGFTRKTLEGKAVVVDEASMVSSEILYEIVKRNPDRLILVGDEAQLPPVGSGQPFHDLIAAVPDAVRTLGTCYRNKEAVFASALAIREGVVPISAKTESESYCTVSSRDASASHAFILEMVRNGNVDFSTDIILCCRNGETDDDLCTVRTLNRDIKALVNPSEDGAQRIENGDRIICLKNSSELDVWNGTTGRCLKFDIGRNMWVTLDFPNANGDRTVLIPREKVKNWTLAYALTVHKAQGSQYRRVYLAVMRRDEAVLLDRKMIYTAVTRAKKDCTIIGDMGAFGRAVQSVTRKRTVIQEIAK